MYDADEGEEVNEAHRPLTDVVVQAFGVGNAVDCSKEAITRTIVVPVTVTVDHRFSYSSIIIDHHDDRAKAYTRSLHGCAIFDNYT